MYFDHFQGDAKSGTKQTKIFLQQVFVEDFVSKLKFVFFLSFRFSVFVSFSFVILMEGFRSNFFDSDSSKIFDVVRDKNVETQIET